MATPGHGRRIRPDDPPSKDHGFTIIELLVAMAIIGLLAAIAIPTYQTIRFNAYNAAAVSDLHEAVTQTQIYYDENGSFPQKNEWDSLIGAGVKLSNPSYENLDYQPILGQDEYAISNYDSRTRHLYCFDSSNGTGIFWTDPPGNSINVQKCFHA